MSAQGRRAQPGERLENLAAELAPLVNAEAEQTLLGSIFIDNRIYYRIARMVRAEHFGNRLHARIFTAIGRLIDKGVDANPVTLKNLFDQDDALVKVGGARYLALLAKAAVLVTNAEDYARLILDLASRRELVAACEEARDDALLISLDRPATVVIQEHTIRVERAVPRRIDCPATYTGITDWLERDIPPPDRLLGELFSTTSRMMLIGPTGLGKTNFVLALGIAVANGDPFLHWTASERPRRVLFIDGEMSNRQMKRRLVDATRRAGSIPDTFHALSLDDLPDMEPLDIEAGQRYIDRLIAGIGGVDLVIFDNIQALLTDDENFGAQSWQRVLPWIRDLTRRSVGQIWVHHTGHNETHGYGSKTREWQFDVVALMEEVERPETHIAFRLKFTKARERNPHNRADFEPTIIMLLDDAWTSERGGHLRATRRTASDRALELLQNAITREGQIPPASEQIPPSTRCVTEGLWRRYCEAGLISEGSPDATRMAFKRAAERLIKTKKVGKWELWVWIVS